MNDENQYCSHFENCVGGEASCCDDISNSTDSYFGLSASQACCYCLGGGKVSILHDDANNIMQDLDWTKEWTMSFWVDLKLETQAC